MQICEKHWADLRKAIEDRGLGHLVAKDGTALKEALDNLIDPNLKPEEQAQHYDPLFNANFMIMAKALDMGGLYLMMADENGNEYCPLCEVDKHGKEHGASAETWITGCTDAILKFCQEKGYVHPKQ